MADPAASGDAPRPGTSDPRRARLQALKVLFQADLRGDAPEDVLATIVRDPQAAALLDEMDEPADPADAVGQEDPTTTAGGTVDAYAIRLVEGVGAHRADLDEVIERFARRWTIRRMPVVDRNVLRLATYELIHEGLSANVVIDQAVELAKALSTENSPRFVNGVLEAVRRWHTGRAGQR